MQSAYAKAHSEHVEALLANRDVRSKAKSLGVSVAELATRIDSDPEVFAEYFRASRDASAAGEIASGAVKQSVSAAKRKGHL